MTKEDVDVILEFQACSLVHPLTCGNNSMHFDLFPHLNTNTGVITLVCVNCDYTQVVDEELMAAVRMALPGAREVENALKAMPVMREKLEHNSEE